jgi:CRISPR-associated protein Cpf1
LIDQQGNIIQQESLNTIKDKQHKIETPYHQLLDKKEKERDEARKSWDTIENIKELKEGYISQVVHKIAQMMIEHNAIVVLEDLNFGFKRGRFKVEKQVYQKLEKMLIDKLNYLVFKDKLPNEAGGIYKAFQLTNKFTSFKDMGKQTGFLFYVPAWNTSKIDPTTGFVDFLNPKYESIEQAKVFFKKFLDIRFNSTKRYFEFSFDYNDFTTKAEDTRTAWTICTHGERIETFRNPEKQNQWDNKEIKLTHEFETLFKKHHIDYIKDENLKEAIISHTEKPFFERLIYLLRLTLQIRNSKTGTEIDYLISPVAAKNGNFYDSRKAGQNLPQDADANGAYHIALKGLWILQKGLFKVNKKGNPELAISNKEWLQFVQSKH